MHHRPDRRLPDRVRRDRDPPIPSSPVSSRHGAAIALDGRIVQMEFGGTPRVIPQDVGSRRAQGQRFQRARVVLSVERLRRLRNDQMKLRS